MPRSARNPRLVEHDFVPLDALGRPLVAIMLSGPGPAPLAALQRVLSPEVMIRALPSGDAKIGSPQ